MKLIIDIDENLLEGIKSDNFDFARQVVKNFQGTIASAIANGTPIPDNATVCDIDALLKEIEQQIRVCYEMQNGDMSGSNEYKYMAQGLQKTQNIIGKYLKGGK